MARAKQEPPELPGFTFVKLLGSGGFSDVFLYEQHLPKRKVAVKVLLTEGLTEENRAAFVAEANLMAQLSAHPYIVSIFHADVSPDGRPYFIMEYCSGASLSERYKRERFAVEEALRIGVRLSSAVATAHGAGILHRDIKPANVLTNDFGWPALTDFGISSAVESELPVHTTTKAQALGQTGTGSGGQSVGMSIPWSPPEMFDDMPKPDVRSDVFSLAATIYTLLAGHTPFEIPGRSNGTIDLMGRIERGQITPMPRNDLPRSLLAVLHKGMSTDAAQRYATAVEFGRALQRVESELGYAPTTIDVPNLVQPVTERPSDGGEDATRARSIATIEAQPASPASPAATGDATRVRGTVTVPQTQPDATRVRGAVTVPQQQAPPAQSPQVPVAERTVARPPTVGLVDTPAPPAETAPATEARKSKRGVLIGAAIAVIVGGGIATAVILNGGDLGGQDPNSGSKPSGPAVIGGSAVPNLELDRVDVKDGTVTFVLRNPFPKDGDLYRWRRTDGPGTSTPIPAFEPVVEIGNVAEGQVVCIEAWVLRDGQTSAVPLEVCHS